MRCPECGFVQGPQARCKRCGTALDASFTPAPPDPDRPSSGGTPEPGRHRSRWWSLAREVFLEVPTRVNPVTFYARVALYLGFAIWGWGFITTDHAALVDGYPPISKSFMHLVNLIFHEAGHVIFMPFGTFMMTLGGTLGQLLIPFIVMSAFLLKTRDAFAAGIGLWWLGQSFLDVAPYINDARAMQLTLLGGVTGRDVPGYHDWEAILRDLGWLQYDHTLAGLAYLTGAALMLLAIAWGAAVLSLQYKNLDKPS